METNLINWLGFALFAAWVAGSTLYNYLRPYIPNWYMGIGLLLAIPNTYFTHVAGQGNYSIWVVTAALALLSLVFFYKNVWGGGDTKFMLIALIAVPDVLAYCSMLLVLALKIFYDLVCGRAENTPPLRAVVYLGGGWLLWFLTQLFIFPR